MDRAFAEIRYFYIFIDSEDYPNSLGDIINACIYASNSRKRASEVGKTGAQSRESQINVDAVGPDLTVSAAVVPSNA